MQQPAQAPDDDPPALKRRCGPAFNGPAALFGSAWHAAALMACTAVMAGCGAGGFTLQKAEVDRSIVTNSISSPSPTEAGEVDADQVTIRNAVSSVDVDEVAGKPIAWANPDTGSRGTIMSLTEDRQAGRLCRRFSGSRESFDGVAMFSGKTCMVGQGVWRVEAFRIL